MWAEKKNIYLEIIFSKGVIPVSNSKFDFLTS